jgi:hypothetical protein
MADNGPPADLDARIADLDRRIKDLSDYIDAHSAEDLDPLEYVKLLGLHGQLTSRLGRLLRDRQTVAGAEDDRLQAAIDDALDHLANEWELDL